ncbi:hypothetical protein BJ508DRAFT_323653 [Ascobolus immersus RN42]|uniref:Uncharacterized protein n=1 Tax=Ascobolus immersus RN42 TaxID=1160509 RepID=A0A3N4IRY9_ASCIM|nr:hypothetical protein BJ508DRAFT_323653 [Ascobolus immersus RN42]
MSLQKLDTEISAYAQSLGHQETFQDIKQFQELYKSAGDDKRPMQQSDRHFAVTVPQASAKALLEDADVSSDYEILYGNGVAILTITGEISEDIIWWVDHELEGYSNGLGLKRMASYTMELEQYQLDRPNATSIPRKPPLLVLKGLNADGPGLIVEIGTSESSHMLHLAAKWWLLNVASVQAVLLIEYDQAGRTIMLEKWTATKVGFETGRGFQYKVACECKLGLGWDVKGTDFDILPGSTDPLPLGSAAELLRNSTIPSTKQYAYSSGRLQVLAEYVMREKEPSLPVGGIRSSSSGRTCIF